MRRVLGPHLENMTSEASLVPPFFPSTRKSFAAEVKNSWGLARSESVCGNTLSQRSTELQRGPEVDPEAMLLRWLGPWGARVVHCTPALLPVAEVMPAAQLGPVLACNPKPKTLNREARTFMEVHSVLRKFRLYLCGVDPRPTRGTAATFIIVHYSTLWYVTDIKVV